MNDKQIATLKKIIEEEEKEYSFNDYVFNFVDEIYLKDFEDADDVINYLRDDVNEDRELTNAEVICYATAMEYLQEHDTSLMESLGLAYEMGFEMETLNSETLASLLMSQNNEEDYGVFCQSVEDRLSEVFDEVTK